MKDITRKPTCPKCGVFIADDDPAYVSEEYAGWICEACWRGTSRAYRRYDPYPSYLLRRRVATASAFVMMAALLLAVVLIVLFIKSR